MLCRRTFGVSAVAAAIAVTTVVLLLPASAAGSSPIVVTTTSDSGPGSLRAAIAAANASTGATIDFQIPTSDPGYDPGGWFTIAPLTPLPIITANGTTIDGTSQTAFTGNTNPTGPEVFLDGRSEVWDGPATPGGLWLEASSTVVEGLAVSGDGGEEIVVDGSDGTVLSGDYVGTDPTGASAVVPPFDPRAFENDGIWVIGGATGTRIGGTTAAARDVVSGNGGMGILVFDNSNRQVIEGDYIGTNATGSAALANGAAGIWIGGYGCCDEAPTDPSFTISGNLISGNNGAVWVFAGGATIQGNLIGTDASGSVAIPNTLDGVVVGNAGNTLIGGPTAAERNVISAGAGNGVSINDAPGTVVLGNYIGTDAAGTAALGNANAGIAIGGTTTGTTIGANTISGNRIGVVIGGGSPADPSGTIIQGNHIGTDAAGVQALGNTGPGIGIYGALDTLIGGTAAGAGNVISGNGVGLDLGLAAGTIVQRNAIGTGVSGAPVPNRNDGVEVSTTGDQPNPKRIEANTIAYNGGNGVGVYGVTGGDTITRNSIFSNGGLGIDLGGDGVTPNDPGDADTGPNNLQNFPVLTSALGSSGHLVVTGTIDTPNPQTTTIELFADGLPAPGGDPSGYGEGAVFLGTATPAADGTFSTTLPAVAAGAPISATATDAAGNTSEFAKDTPVMPASTDGCKNGGWAAYGIFKNQGDCVSFVATHGRNAAG